MDRVSLTNMRVFTHVGCTEQERHVGQHLEVDIDFYLDLQRVDDRIERSVDYAVAYKVVKDAAEAREAFLIETIAERAAAALLAMPGLPPGARVTVRVRKGAPPIPGGHADHAEVEITRP